MKQRCNCGEWRAEKWSDCSSRCGDGFQKRIVACFVAEQAVDSRYCDLNKRPVHYQPCSQKCVPKWRVTPSNECSVSCGIGWQYRLIECVNEDGTQSDACDKAQKPNDYEPCLVADCPVWQHGSWSDCSASCGEGVKKRLIVCRFSNGTIVDHSFCNYDIYNKPDESMSCAGNTCASWATGAWSECNWSTCKMVRLVKCVLPNGTQMAELNCERAEKPSVIVECTDRSKCELNQMRILANRPRTTTSIQVRVNRLSAFNTQAIKSTTTPSLGVLKYTSWSNCSSPCGDGVRTRQASCVSRDGRTKLSMDLCGQLAREELNIKCNLAKCEYNLTEKWSKVRR